MFAKGYAMTHRSTSIILVALPCFLFSCTTQDSSSDGGSATDSAANSDGASQPDAATAEDAASPDGGAAVCPSFGEAVSDPEDSHLPAHVDVLEFEVFLNDETVSAYFTLRGLPAEIEINRADAEQGALEFKWEVLIDADNNVTTGCGTPNCAGADYALSIGHYVNGAPDTVPLAEALDAAIWEMADDQATRLGDARVVVLDDLLGVFGEVPGLDDTAVLHYGTMSFNPLGSNFVDEDSCR